MKFIVGFGFWENWKSCFVLLFKHVFCNRDLLQVHCQKTKRVKDRREKISRSALDIEIVLFIYF